MPRQEITVTAIKQYKYPKAIFPNSKVDDNEVKRLALTDIANELNTPITEEFFDAYMVNDGTYAIKNSNLTLKSNHIGAIANIMAKGDIESKYGPLDPTTNPKIYKFDEEGNPYLKSNIDDELYSIRKEYESKLDRALYIDSGLDPRRTANNINANLEEFIRNSIRRHTRPIATNLDAVPEPTGWTATTYNINIEESNLDREMEQLEEDEEFNENDL